MAKLFVIDQSLDRIGGHHFEMVRLISQAARHRGFDVIVGTHKKFAAHAEELPEVELRPVFHRTTYSQFSQLESLQQATRSRRRWIFPPRELRAGPTGQPAPPADRPAQTDYHRSEWLRRFNNAWLERGQNRLINEFAGDCRECFSPFRLQDGDRILFLTMNELDFMGLAAYLSCDPQTIQARWHAVFHFGIVAGRPADSPQHRDRVAHIRYCFQAALARTPYHQYQLLTSTEELADQYNQLGVGYFRMLPYPIQPIEDRADAGGNRSPFQLTLAGGLRREKGKQAIQRVASDLAELRDEGYPSQLVVQTRPRKWFQARELQLTLPPSIPAEFVRTLPHPLPAAEYSKLIRSTDIGLLLYDGETYYARRAGILCEYLAAGRPVVVPAGCWLSHQLNEPASQHVERMMARFRSAPTRDLDSFRHARNNVPQAGGIVAFDRSRHPFYMQGDLESPCAAIAIQFDWHWPRQPGTYVRIRCTGYNQHQQPVIESERIVGQRRGDQRPNAMFQLGPDVTSIQVELTNAYDDATASLSRLGVTPLGSPDQEIPYSAVGTCFDEYSQVRLAVREIMRHYDHYRKTANQFAQIWREWHDPELTVDYLIREDEALHSAA